MKKKILYLICDREALRRWRSGGWEDSGDIKTAHELWSVIGRVHELYKQGWADLTRWVIVEVDVSFLGAWNMGHGNWEFIAPVVPHDFGRAYPAYTVLA